MNKNQIREFIKREQKVETCLGTVEKLISLGEGGNGLVYKGKLHDKEVALKFLAESQSRKVTRFKAEYLNIQSVTDPDFIVRQLNFEEVDFDTENVPTIIMEKYLQTLKEYRKNIQFSEVELVKLLNFLLKGLKHIHSNGIIHRDLKPSNILVDELGKFYLADFGIAYYNPEMFSLKAMTQKGDKMGNYEFSAPEISDKNVVPSVTMDIYSLGQLLQWSVFNQTHKGTGRERFSSVLEGDLVSIIDRVVDKCIRNRPEERFQSIDEMNEFIEDNKYRKPKIDVFDDINIVDQLIRKVEPKAYNSVQYLTSEKHLNRLFNEFSNAKLEQGLTFNTGIGNADIDKLTRIEFNKWSMDGRVLCINGVWMISTDRSYDDLILLNCTPDGVEGRSYSVVTSDMFEGSYEIEAHKLESGYIEINDVVYPVKDLRVDNFYANINYRYVAIGARFNSIVLPSGDSLLDEIQDKLELSTDDVVELQCKIFKLQNREVKMRL